MNQLEFRVFVTECLLRQEKEVGPKTPRPPKTNEETALNAIRQDKIGHGIEKSKTARRCRVCHKHTTFKCLKCDIALHTKCFNTFHNV